MKNEFNLLIMLVFTVVLLSTSYYTSPGIAIFVLITSFFLYFKYDYFNNPQLNFGRRPISEETRIMVLRRQGGTCAMCNEKNILDLHHKLHVSQGGTNDPDNLIYLCPTHHMMVHRTKSTEEIRI